MSGASKLEEIPQLSTDCVTAGGAVLEFTWGRIFYTRERVQSEKGGKKRKEKEDRCLDPEKRKNSGKGESFGIPSCHLNLSDPGPSYSSVAEPDWEV